MKLRNLLLLNLIIFFQSAFSQEGIAVYTDYLTGVRGDKYEKASKKI